MSQIEITRVAPAIAALKRIARKPWPASHTRRREFYRKDGRGLSEVKVFPQLPASNDLNDPMWLPEWAASEQNPCDCPKCIALRALQEMTEV